MSSNEKEEKKLRQTSSFVTAAQRLAPHVGITMTSTGRAWTIENENGPWPSMNVKQVLGRLIMFAVAEHGMTYREVAALCRLRSVPDPARLTVGRGAGWWMSEIARMLAAQARAEAAAAKKAKRKNKKRKG